MSYNLSSSTHPPNRPVCKFFLKNQCIHGASCFFSHTLPGTTPTVNSSSSPALQHKIYCKFFLNGYCHRGASCYFVHEHPPAEPPRSPTIQPEASTKGKGRATPLPEPLDSPSSTST